MALEAPAVGHKLRASQALFVAAQSALVAEHCQEEIRIYGNDAVYGVYRLLERLARHPHPLPDGDRGIAISTLAGLWRETSPEARASRPA